MGLGLQTGYGAEGAQVGLARLLAQREAAKRLQMDEQQQQQNEIYRNKALAQSEEMKQLEIAARLQQARMYDATRQDAIKSAEERERDRLDAYNQRAADSLQRQKDNDEWRKRDSERSLDLRQLAIQLSQANRGQMTPQQAFGAIQNLNNAWARDVKTAKTINDHFKTMRSTWDVLQKSPTIDMNMVEMGIIYPINKIFDPTSVVRESEYARTAQGQSLLRQLAGVKQKIQRGGSGLTLESIAEAIKVAEQVNNNALQYMAQRRQQNEAIANQYGLPANLLLQVPTQEMPGDDLFSGDQQKPPTAPAPTQNQSPPTGYKPTRIPGVYRK